MTQKQFFKHKRTSLITSEIDNLKKTAFDVRKKVFSMILTAHASHLASAYSIVEVLVYLYQKVLHLNPSKPASPNRDRFILSKGWGVSALYVLLSKKGFFSKKLLNEYCKDGSKMIGIATRNGIRGIEATTGSMGHGLPIGVGLAKAMKLQGKKNRTVVLISDGECDTGSTWESILLAAHHKLDNLLVIVDYNKWQSFGRTNEVLNLEPLINKWKAFNWHAEMVRDGHDFYQIDKAFKKCFVVRDKPQVIIAHTIKGKGLSAIEDRNEWHYQTPRENEIKVAKLEGLI
ncbi:hypothetical protein A2866_05555 [Candidatus Roizmanbacteria bacterium RIFCSPHIGHO2_01_FULL_39_8]|uniref:Transketolase N-terminal domain-containing protein n=3 Tax=Candidatus Roizmaniibacteriota TaxID=1752723 RepID=A0A1F7GFT1_9BACT|nr:MAG: hypothetical protein A2866_05555 [Candidatus Roizmanbacteria bacterium RIFCSPHIGHO2_01_FULL_39_8]OGK26595.1 MAG: hypothetical protein A3C28_03765 [Candidatus Roizmanbacteria bacterium RIFCSPHIGHO2_02_FULL_39_9]OGK37811.1 MAG: hypothetical protein A3F60_00085 [Candidatus Roizmanbacteria bacterium RIFCSPHIGHO2_12_FULL_39_8]